MHSLSSTSSRGLGDNVDVNAGAVQGPRGGYAAGATVTGPRGNTAGGAAAVGPYGGTAAARGVEGAGGAGAVQAAAVGPGGRVAAGSAARGPAGGTAARGFAAGPGGYAAGFRAVSPSGRYATGAAVRGNWGNYGIYGAGWYGAHPGAWYPTAWAAGAAWTAATWASAGAYCGCDDSAPVYYDYGNNVTYQDNSVYVNGQDAGSSQEYYDQASSLASAGADSQASPDENWLPLGVFAMTKGNETQADLTLQLAVNKQGIIRGNATDAADKKTQTVQGSVDKSTQRVAFTVGDDKTTVVETGLYNLTKDEAPALIHVGKDKTEQCLLTRLKQPDATNQTSP